MRAFITPVSATAASVAILIAKFRKAAEQRFQLGLLNREFEKLQQRSECIAHIAESVASARQKIVDAYNAMTSAVGKFRDSLDEAGAAILANQRLNENLDDEILRAKLLDIDEMSEPESNKNILRSRAMAAARDRKEKGAREAKRETTEGMRQRE